MLERKQWKKFKEIIDNIPNIINNLRRDEYNRTLLMTAVLKDNIEISQHILSYEQDVSVVDRYGYNVFHWIAICRRDDDAMKMITLFEDQQHVHWKDVLNKQTSSYKRTPLHYAAWKNKHKLVRWMCDKGADVEVRDFINNRPDEHPHCDEETKKIIRQFRKW